MSDESAMLEQSVEPPAPAVAREPPQRDRSMQILEYVVAIIAVLAALTLTMLR